MIEAAFRRFAAVSGLDLNLSKTIVIPLGDESVDTVKARLGAVSGFWRAIQVAEAGTDLGYAVGPGKGTSSWDKAVKNT